jgi:hypothetical protein
MICLSCQKSFNGTKNQKYCCFLCSAQHAGKLRTEKTIAKYSTNPKLCLRCLNAIPFEKRFENIYCSSSCAATVNNTLVPKRKRKKNEKGCLECNAAISHRNDKYCSFKCQQEYLWKTVTKPRVLKGGSSVSTTLRRFLSETRGYHCERCKINEWDGEKLVLQVDHIDGDPDNNFPSNLRLLCPNCHSLTPTYKGGNKKNPKQARRAVMHREIYARKTGSLHCDSV